MYMSFTVLIYNDNIQVPWNQTVDDYMQLTIPYI